MNFVKFGEIVTISKGRKLSNVYSNSALNKQRYIQIDDLRNDSNLKYSSDAGVEVKPEDLIIAWDGANAGTVGYGLEGLIGSTLARLRLTDKDCHAPFVGRFLQSKFSYIRANCTGATIPHVSRNVLEQLSVPSPPLPEQHRMTTILDKADALRQKRKQSLKLLDEFIRSVFLDMFGDPASNPNKWKERSLGDVIDETQYGTSKPAGEYGNGTQILRMNNITTSGEIDLKDLKWIELSASDIDKFTVQKDDILFNRTNSPELVGKTAVWESDHQFAYAGYLVRIRLIRQISNPYYVSAFLNSGYGKRLLFSKAKASINMSNISPTLLKEFTIPIPPIDVQNQFEAIVKATRAQKNTLRKSEDMLNDQFNALVQRAFRGEL